MATYKGGEGKIGEWNILVGEWGRLINNEKLKVKNEKLVCLNLMEAWCRNWGLGF